MTHKQRVLALLRDGQAHSHHELYSLNVIAHSRIADLRADGYRIEQWREGDLYLYRLIGSPLDERGGLSAPKGDGGLSIPASSPRSPSGPDDPGVNGVAQNHGQLTLTGAEFRKQVAA